ncbi:MAG: trypsin-like peptidase domain-containing protein [Janthinobacterium lividum]
MKKTCTQAVCGLLLGAVLLPSCATIISTPKQSILISGQPEGSTIYVNDKPIAAKPAGGAPGAVRVRLPRKRSAEIKVKHEGYKDYNEVMTADKSNGVVWLNYLMLGALAGGVSSPNGKSQFNIAPFLVGLLGPFVGSGIDAGTGASRKFSKTEVHPLMPRLPQAVAGGQTVQAGLVNVRVKGGDKMGNLFIMKETTEILYFGKSLDVDADHLKADVNSTLKELGFNVPSSEGRSVFATGSSSRYTLQGEMRDIKYDINATSRYEAVARFETSCTVEVTWKLLNQSRQAVVEQKTTGSSVKFEKGGSAAFEDAFENALYAFLGNQEVTAALAKPSGSVAATPAAAAPAAADKLAPIKLHRAAKPVADNGLSTAARSVVIVETADGHGSGCIVSPDGYIVTNAHVVGDQDEVKVQLADGVQVKGKVVRVNPEMDLALLKINTDGLQAFVLPSASAAEIGADVFAIGTPADKELGQTVTKGIISARRNIEGHAFLQTDVSINGGNSGGALVTRTGQLLGIVNAKLVGRGIEGIGFAIPAEQVSDALQLTFID